MITFEGRVAPAARAESVYLYLPFDVPEGAERIDVRYAFEAGSILDLGLFDPEAAPFPSTTGFRGWSGSARRAVFVSAKEATPGYLPGELQAGRWQVVLGLALVAEAGCDYRVEVAVSVSVDTAAGKPVVAGTPAALPTASTRDVVTLGASAAADHRAAPRPGPGWYRGDLQSHTYYSDARGSIADLVAEARSRSLDFLAVTDHNTSSHHRELAAWNASEPGRGGPLLVPGEEVTTYRGHANVWGVSGWTDFRLERPGDLERLVRHVNARDGLFSVNHPKVTPGCLGCDWEYEVPDGAASLEAWQGPWLMRNWDSLARYDALLRSGRMLTLVGGSDRHHPGYPNEDPPALQVGSPTTWLELVELSVPAVLGAVRTGHAFVSESPAGPLLELEVGGVGMGGAVAKGEAVAASARVRGAPGDVLTWVGSGGVLREVAIEGDDFTDAWEWSADGAYLRVEVVARASLPAFLEELARFEAAGRLPPYLKREEVVANPWRRALSNPVYVR
ncbi:MAG: CehA/McbA family metallohydrolase [Trueperaceae bacterium]|nr:CehA/McbA family metallohydrolase [Trueperaceae bacterium]